MYGFGPCNKRSERVECHVYSTVSSILRKDDRCDSKTPLSKAPSRPLASLVSSIEIPKESMHLHGLGFHGHAHSAPQILGSNPVALAPIGVVHSTEDIMSPVRSN